MAPTGYEAQGAFLTTDEAEASKRPYLQAEFSTAGARRITVDRSALAATWLVRDDGRFALDSKAAAFAQALWSHGRNPGRGVRRPGSRGTGRGAIGQNLA